MQPGAIKVHFHPRTQGTINRFSSFKVTIESFVNKWHLTLQQALRPAAAGRGELDTMSAEVLGSNCCTVLLLACRYWCCSTTEMSWHAPQPLWVSPS